MENLKHSIENLENGGFVFVLDTGATIDPQAEAMLQALHSRSTGGIKSHLKVLQEKGAENFMEKFYVGYGHKSIGDCGSATIFVEGVSMLAAKAIQDWRLYSGQEASTRYVDFSHQPFLDILNTSESKQILEDWRDFYLQLQIPVQEHLKKKFVLGPDENEKTYEKAIIARAFDITRGFLPAGASTNLAWRMNFRQFADEIMMLRHHPLAEVRDIAEKSEKALQNLFLQSFSHKRYDGTESYNHFLMENYYYENEKAEDFKFVFNGVDTEMLKEFKEILEKRPARTELPNFIANTGSLTYEFLLDFGSFRDLQRHRAIAQRMPLLVENHGFGEWYIDSLPDEWKQKTLDFVSIQQQKIDNLKCDKYQKQYYLPMGYKVPCQLTGDLKAITYLAELRSTRFVHPTLVKQMLKLSENLIKRFGEFGLTLHLDMEPNRFDIKRGEHDIVMK